MKKAVWKSAFLGIIFLAALYIISAIMNKGNTDMTTEMGEATYPVVYVQYNGDNINEMHGYAQTMEVSNMMESITPLLPGRKVNLYIKTYGRVVSEISFEVRSLDGSRLIENTQVTEYTSEKDGISASFGLKDLIEAQEEYILVTLLTLDNGNIVRYYTRVVSSEEYYTGDKMDFVKEFSNKTFDKEAAKDLTRYMESNSQGDNTTFGKVTIHSNFNQVTWGDLQVTKETEPQITIKELATQTGNFLLNYYVSAEEGSNKNYYEVEEYYRIRYTKDRIYLLDFERTMNQIYDESSDSYANNKIMLGITGNQVFMEESDGGNVIVFITGNRLYSYNIIDNKLIYLFGFYNNQNMDERTLYDKHKIKLLNLDEAGNITFMVYGYMNRGRHEGQAGISVYYYDSTVNTVEELVYVPYDKSPDLLMAEVEQLSYINKNGILYLMLDNQIYGISATERSSHIVVKNMVEGCYKVSESSQMIVWQEQGGLHDGKELILMNLNTGKKTSIKAGTGEVIAPIGFMQDDLIYGVAKETDIVANTSGSTVFPMYCVKIQNESDGVLKQKNYSDINIFITGGEIIGNQIIFSRVLRNEMGEYEKTKDAYIVNDQVESKKQNTIEVAVTEKYEKITQIAVKSEIKPLAMKRLTPKEVLFEGGRNVVLKDNVNNNSRFYVYGKTGVEGIFMDESNALNLAYDISGVVTNDSGNYVWIKGNRSLRNQIMAIEGESVTEEKSSLAVCLDTMLEFEGVSRNTEYLLKNGESVLSILEDNLENAQILDLSGCSLDAVLYYVNLDIPVLVMQQDGTAMLLIGFNEMNTVVMNPLTGTVGKMGMNDSKELFEQNNNLFITYIKNEK